jgi:hypothetical protein
LTPGLGGDGIGGVKLYRQPLPRDLVLDLVAITRMLYAVEHARGGHPMKLQEIADVGKSPRVALDLAKSGPESMGMRAAWTRVDETIEALGDLLKDEQALPLLKTVEARLLKAKRA